MAFGLAMGYAFRCCDANAFLPFAYGQVPLGSTWNDGGEIGAGGSDGMHHGDHPQVLG